MATMTTTKTDEGTISSTSIKTPGLWILGIIGVLILAGAIVFAIIAIKSTSDPESKDKGDDKNKKVVVATQPEAPTLPARKAYKLQERQHGVMNCAMIWVDSDSISSVPMVPGDFIVVSFLADIKYSEYHNGREFATIDLRNPGTSREIKTINPGPLVSVGYKLEEPSGTKVLMAYCAYYPESAKPADDIWFPAAIEAGVMEQPTS